jgi:hypothetical protein
MKECDSKRYWIGGEGLPSIDIGKGRERSVIQQKDGSS